MAKSDSLIHVTGRPRFTPSAFREDLQFEVSHYSDVGRVALASADDSKQWLATIAKPLTRAQVRFFEASELDDTREWATGTNR